MNPLFMPENLERASDLIECLRDMARTKGCSPAQLALAWVIRRPNVVAIPGASRLAQLESNAEAADIDLTSDDDRQLTESAERFEPVGGLGVARGMAESLVGAVRGRLARTPKGSE